MPSIIGRLPGGRQVGFDKATLESIDRALKVLKKLPKELEPKARRKVLRNAAKPLIQQAKVNAPQSKAIHFRYANGKKVAAYKPGNLEESIGFLRLRKTQDVFVGPRTARRVSGTYGSTRVDAYYAHWVEFGTRNQKPQSYMRKAFHQTKGQVFQSIIRGVAALVHKYQTKHKI